MRRHPFLILFTGLAILVLAAVAFFLATFDLNHYRRQLEAGLEGLLKRPVHLGEASLDIDRGLALAFDEFRVGAPDDAGLSLDTRRLLVRFSPWDLLQGRVTAGDIRLEAPRLTLVLDGNRAESADGPRHHPAWAVLQRLKLKSCVIDDGRLTVFASGAGGREKLAVLSGLDGWLQNFAPGSEASVHLQGRLEHDGAAARLDLDLQTLVPDTLPLQMPARYRLDLALRDLPLAWLPLRNGDASRTWDLGGHTTFRARLTGDPDLGPRAELHLSGSAVDLQMPDGRLDGGLFRTLAWQGTWTRSDTLRLSGLLTLDAGAFTAGGPLDVVHAEGATRLTTELTVAEIALETILERFAPAAADLAAQARRHRLAGTVHDLVLRCDTTLAALQNRPLLESFQGRLRLSGVSAELGEAGRLEDGKGQLSFADRTLTISGATARLPATRFELAGRIDFPAAAPPRQELTLSGVVAGAELADTVAALPSDLHIDGKVPFSLDLSGPLTRPLYDLSADLDSLEASWGGIFTKPAGLPSELLLSGELTGKHVGVGFGRLRVPPFEVKANGFFSRDRERRLDFDLALPEVALGLAAERFPFLKPFHPRGELSLALRLVGREGRLDKYTGSLSMQDVGFHLTDTVADLNGMTGLVGIETDQADFEGLNARLGTSPLTLSGRLEWDRAPRARLHLQAPLIQAAELIFPSREAVLRALDAHLELSRERLVFAPATVRLDGGTEAEVRGEVRFSRPVEVDLDIESSYGNLDEVIALWDGPQSRPDGSRKGPPVKLQIDARAKRGIINGMDFSQAEGRISLQGRNLVIHPLRCSIGPGYAIGQVLVERDGEAAPLLRISGHAENLEAGTVYRQLLDHESLVKGALRGDFYLEGRSGPRFLATARGGFSTEVQQGVLRRFTFLSRVFSLLNVSQILSFRVPETDREGMPFERLRGNFRLEKGVLSSEDLFVDSNAMNLSMVGDLDLVEGRIDAVLGVKPLRTVDKIVTNIPIAGWLLTGEEKALVTAHFAVRGSAKDPQVVPIPINSLSGKVLGIFRRVLGLPGRMVEDLGELGREEE